MPILNYLIDEILLRKFPKRMVLAYVLEFNQILIVTNEFLKSLKYWITVIFNEYF